MSLYVLDQICNFATKSRTFCDLAYHLKFAQSTFFRTRIYLKFRVLFKNTLLLALTLTVVMGVFFINFFKAFDRAWVLCSIFLYSRIFKNVRMFIYNNLFNSKYNLLRVNYAVDAVQLFLCDLYTRADAIERQAVL